MAKEIQKIDYDEVDNETGFKRIEQYVWMGYEK